MTPLSPRQEQVAELVARGRTYKAIAKELNISRFTVHRHIVAIGARLPGVGATRERIMAWYVERIRRAA